MTTCKTFSELQALGVEKIHEKTHISRDKIELVLTKSYGEINKIQFMGFISILEREYGIDLNDIKEEFLQYQEEHKNSFQPKQSVILQPSSRAKQKWIMAGLLLILMLIVGGYLTQAKMANDPYEEVMQLSTAAVEVIDDAKELNTSEAVEINATEPVNEQNASVPQASAQPVQPVQNVSVASGLELRPVYKVWVGLIDLATQQKTQMITKEPIKIDTSKNWLIVLGHGRVEIVSPAGNEMINDANTVWFQCENGVLKRLTNKEFIAANGGKGW